MKVIFAIGMVCLAFFIPLNLAAQIKPQPQVLEVEPNQNYLELAALHQKKAGSRLIAAKILPLASALIAGGLYLNSRDETNPSASFKNIAYATVGVGFTISFFLDIAAAESLQKSGHYLELQSRL